MASTKTRVKTIRISNESADYFENIPLNRAVESLYSLLQSKNATFDGENIHFGGVHTEKTKNSESLSAELEDIEAMVGLFGISFEDFTVKLCEAMNDGTIYIDEGEIKVQTDLMLDEFYEVCHEANVEPQDAINKVVQMLRR